MFLVCARDRDGYGSYYLCAFAYKNPITAATKLGGAKLRTTELGRGENRNGYEHQQHNQLGDLGGRLGLCRGEGFQCWDAAENLHQQNEHIEIQSDHRTDGRLRASHPPDVDGAARRSPSPKLPAKWRREHKTAEIREKET